MLMIADVSILCFFKQLTANVDKKLYIFFIFQKLKKTTEFKIYTYLFQNHFFEA